MEKEEMMRSLMEGFDESASEESCHEGAPSQADVIATQYTRRLSEGRKKAAREGHGMRFEG